MRNAFVIFVCAGVLAGCASDVGSGTEELRQTCGGFAGIACPSGFECVDDPHDGCDPDLGGADCGGICRHVRRGGQCNGPDKHYVSRDPSECAAIRYLCADGQEAFSDACGCGCQDVAGGCGIAALCIIGYVWDDRTCSCVPDTQTACGTGFCPAGQECCNASCGICTEPGGVCTQQVCGTAL